MDLLLVAAIIAACFGAWLPAAALASVWLLLFLFAMGAQS